MVQQIRSELLRQPRIPIGFLNDLNQCTSRQDVFSAYAQWSSRIIKADRTTVAIADVNDGVFDLMAIDGNQAINTGMRIPIEGTLIGRVFETQTPEICPDLSASTDGEAPKLAAGGLTSCMDVPLSAGDRHFGVLAQGFATPPVPNGEDLAVLHAIANCLGSHLLLHEQLEILGKMALTDPLTRVFNRRVFDDRIGDLWSKMQSDGDRFSIALVDLDHFKRLNDSFGHEFGDQVLIAVADTLCAMSRPTDTVIRMGGEEFCVVLENTDIDQAKTIVERLCREVENLRFERLGQSVQVTASFGVASVDEAHDSPRLVSILADKALYSAKREGRNRVVAAA